ncbi:MAG: ATP-binding protein [Gammaproteobacteria bacterium]|nr:ATP-binding protein [Gammaproteobacteria bacterium]
MRDMTATDARTLLDWVLSSGETQRLETKWVSGKMVGKALETVCSFANTRGGWLMLGVEDATKAKGEARLFGIGENPEAVDEVLRKLASHLLPAVESVLPLRIHVSFAMGRKAILSRCTCHKVTRYTPFLMTAPGYGVKPATVK